MPNIDIPTVASTGTSQVRTVPVCTIATRVLDGVDANGQDVVVENYNGDNVLRVPEDIFGLTAAQQVLLWKRVAEPLALMKAGYEVTE